MNPLRISRPRSAVVVAPHPDDETIGAFGLIRLLRIRGCRVRILIVSDGAGSHKSSVKWPAARLIAERRRETLRAMRALGVTARDISFLGLPDGQLGRQRSHENTIGRAIRQISNVDLMVAPVVDDAHPDHSFVAGVVARTPLSAARRLGYLVWASGKPGTGAQWDYPLRDARLAKRAAICRYRTQMGLIEDDPAGFAIAPHHLRAFSTASEVYKEARRCGQSR